MEEKDVKLFKFKDIFQAWNHSFRFHRLAISAIALIISVIIFLLLFRPIFFLSFQITDFAPEKLISFRNILAIILISFIFFISKMCIAYSVRREAVDDEIFVGWKDIGKFLAKHFKTFIFFILGWIFLFLLIAIGQLFFYVIGMIPYVGSLWLSIMYLIPFAISIFLLLTLIVLLFAKSYGAIIIGVEQQSAMDTIINLYHFVKDHGIYIIVTQFLSFLVGIIAWIFVYSIIHGAVYFTNWGASLIMGKEFSNIALPKFFGFINILFAQLPFTSYGGGYYLIPGFIIGVILIIIVAVGATYFFTYMSAAETFIYLSSQKKVYPKKDEEIEEKEEEEEETEKEEKEKEEKEESQKTEKDDKD